MSKHDHCCTDTAVSTCSNFIVERTGKLYILHCKIRFRTILPLCTTSGFAGLLRYFYEHTVTVLISQLISCLTCTYQYRRGVSFMISLQHADQKNTDGNSQLATTLHTLRTYLCIKPGKISTKREHENTIPAQPYGQPRAVSYARAYNLARRQIRCRRRGDAGAVYYVCLYLSIDAR